MFRVICTETWGEETMLRIGFLRHFKSLVFLDVMLRRVRAFTIIYSHPSSPSQQKLRNWHGNKQDICIRVCYVIWPAHGRTTCWSRGRELQWSMKEQQGQSFTDWLQLPFPIPLHCLGQRGRKRCMRQRCF